MLVEEAPALAGVEAASGAESFWRRPAAWAALALAVAVRVVGLADKPFWRDEAWVAGLAGGPVADALTGPQRAVPIGFLLLTKLASTFPLLPEVALRLLPLTAGLATLVALPALARRLGASLGTQLTVLWLAAGTPALVYYARELKPYSLDALVATVAALHALPVPERRPGLGWACLGVLALAPWITFGSVFAVVAALGSAALSLWRSPDRREARRLAAAALVYGASFLLAWSMAIRWQAGSPRLAQTWAEELAAYRPATPLAAVRASLAYLDHGLRPLFPLAAPVAAALGIVGALGWPRYGRARLLTLCTLTAATTVGAALVGGYPVSQGRLLLFAAPGLLLLVAGGVSWAGAAVGRRGLPGEQAAVLAVASYALAWSVVLVGHRYRIDAAGTAGSSVFDVIEDVEPLIGATEALRAPGDKVMVSKYAGESFRYYARGRLPEALVCTRVDCRTEGPVLRSWLTTVGDGRGFLLLLAEDDEAQRHRTLREAGFAWREAAKSRGARLWEVRRADP